MPNIRLYLTNLTSDATTNPITGSEGDVITVHLFATTGYHLPALIQFGAGITTKAYNKDSGTITFTMPASDSSITAVGLDGLSIALIGKVTFAEQQTAIKDAILDIPSSLPTRFCEYIETTSTKIIIHNHGGTQPTQEITLSGLPAVPAGGNVYLHADASEQIEWVAGSGGTTVVANPTLAGTEANLVGLEVYGTKYALPYEASANKVTSINASSTDTQYASAKCLADLIKFATNGLPLTFTAQEANSTISYAITGTLTVQIQTSTDLITWTSWDGTAITLANVGDKMYVRNTNNTLSLGSTNYLNFAMTGKISASGNVMSLVNYSRISSSCFENLFNNCASLLSAPEFPSNIVKTRSYVSTFKNCTSLVEPPELPITTFIGKYNCWGMFSGCSSLLYAPFIPATTMTNYSLYATFQNCTSLREIKGLSITTLAQGSCNQMFKGCSSLKVNDTGTTGKLFFISPADITPVNCVNEMFANISGGTVTVTASTSYYNG